MDTLDAEVLNTACDWIRSGHRTHLFTVSKTWGSAPRPVGAWLVIRDDGRVKGSVSGGCIEDDLIARVRSGEFDGVVHAGSADANGTDARGSADVGQATASAASPARRLRYGVSAEEARRFGLPCGGQLELVSESLDHLSWLSDLAERIARGDRVQRSVHLATGRVTLRTLAPTETGIALRCTDTELISLHGPQWRLFIVGAGQISDYLAPMAQAVGFAVTVCDPRTEYTDGWAVAGTHLKTGMPDDELIAFRPDARTAIVMLTHDPKLDDLALIDALPSAAFYVGALGSVRNQHARRERLMTHFHLSAADFERLHGPVGLPIGSRTPPEIAVSIMAEIIAEKNRLLAQTEIHHPACASA